MSKFGKLKPDVKRRWLEALRSGEYEQGTDYLHQANGRMCCLGVLCHLAEQDGVVESRPFRDDDQGVFIYGTATTMPPNVVVEWAFEEQPVGGCSWSVSTTGDGMIALAELNDDKGLSFAEIADVVEDQL